QKHLPETIRFLLLNTHYRSPIEYSDDRLIEMQKALDGFQRFFERFERITKTSYYALPAPTSKGAFDPSGANADFLAEIARLRNRLLEWMDDDLNTGGAVGILFELLTALNRFVDTKQLEGAKPDAGAVKDFSKAATVVRELSQILGLFQAQPARAADNKLLEGLIQLLIDLRAEARKSKNFAMADQIREGLKKLGVTPEDRQGGTGWRVG